MATSLGLALQISANTKGLESGLSAADKALKSFASQLNGVGKQFDSFASTAGKLPATMQAVADEATRLGQSFREGSITQEQLVQGLRDVKDSASGLVETFKFGEQVTASYVTESQLLAEKQAQLDKAFEAGAVTQKIYAQATADIAAQQERLSPAYASSQAALAAQNAELEEANRVTAQLATAEENYAAEVQRLEKLLNKGYITQETYNRGVDKAAKTLPAATAALERQAQAQRKRDAELSRASQITAAAATNEEKYAKEIQELDKFLAKGLITQQTYNRSLDAAKSKFGQVAASADKAGVEFNELSGIFGLLPGPLGAAAARISSFSSALGGLGKIFKGGSLNIGSLIGSFKSMLTPVNLAAAGIVAFGAAVVGIGKGLNAMETRIELIDRAARLLGSSFDFAQGIQIAVERTGRSFKEVQEPIARFQVTLQKAREGNEVAQRGFLLAGISLETLQDKAVSAPELFAKLAESFKKIKDPAQKAAAEFAVFGEQGPKLRDTFAQINDGAKDAKELGANITAIEKSNFQSFGKAVDRLKTSFTGLGQNLLAPFVGAGEAITRGLVQLTQGFSKFAGAILDFLSPVFTIIGTLVQQTFSRIGTALNRSATLLEPLAAAGRMVNQVFIELSRIMDGFFNIINRGFDYVADLFREAFDYTEEIADAFQRLYNIAARVGEIFLGFGKKVGEALANGAQKAKDFALSIPGVETAANKIGAAAKATSKFVGDSAKAIGNYGNYVLEYWEKALGIEDLEQPEIEILPDLSKFEDELQKSLANVSDLGVVGLDIREEYVDRLKELSVEMQKGNISAQEMEKAVAKATADMDKQVEAAQEVQDALNKQIESEQKIIASLEEQALIDEQFGGDSKRFKASQNILAIENEIARVENEIFLAQLAGDEAAQAAGAKRLAQLDQLKSKEDDIASGRVAAEKEAAKQRKKLGDAQLEAVKEALVNAADIASPSTEALKAVDANTEAGIAEAFRLANGDDPAQKTELKQLKTLEEIRDELKNQPTEVLIGS